MEFITNGLTAEEFIKQRNGFYQPGIDSSELSENITDEEDPDDTIEIPTIQPVKRSARRHINAAMPLLTIAALICTAVGFLLYGSFFGTLPQENVDAYLRLRVEGGFFANASASFFGALAWAAVPFFTGFCAVGHPVTLLTLPIKGIGIGMAAAYFINGFGANGAAAIAILLAPSAALGTLITAYQCKISLSASSRLFSYITGRYNDARPSVYYGQYISRSVFCAFCCLGVGIIDALISVLCGGMFVIE
ncbi:MAG: hypothetical protein J1E39_06835 [Eubacterium sp.]|nr:hypothetical protein [Eubacterium sp.]